MAHFNKIALQVTIDMSHAATCLATLRKEKDSSTFPVTCNTTFCCIAGCENGVLHVQFFSQLATQRLLRCKLQEKLRRVTNAVERGASVQHIITSRVTKSTAGIRRVAKLDFMSATTVATVATVARFYHTKREKKTYPHCVRSLLFKRNHITFCLTANRPLPLLVVFASPR